MPVQSSNFNRSSKQPLSEQLAHMNFSMGNIIALFNGLAESIKTNSSFIPVTIENYDGTTSEISIPSTSYLYTELLRISKNMEQLSSIDTGTATLVDASGNPRTIKLTTLLRSLPGDLTSIEKVPICKTNVSSAIYDLMMPCPKMEFRIPKEFNCHEVKVKRLRFDNDTQVLTNFEEGTDFQTCVEIAQRLGLQYTVVEDIYHVDIDDDKYYGAFSILEKVERRANGDIVVVLDKLTYSDIRSIQNTRQLAIGDLLANRDGIAVYSIVDIDILKNRVVLHIASGFDNLGENLSAGIKQLWYQYASENVQTVSVPITANERSLAFLSPVNPGTNSTGGFTTGFKIDTSTLQIVASNNASIDFDTWFNQNVINVGKYLQSVAEDINIPLLYGIAPATPILDPNSFQVVQINKHITDTSSVERIRLISQEKEQTYTKLTTINEKISVVNERINIGRYRSIKDRKDDQNLLSTLATQKTDLTKTYESLVKDIAASTDNTETLGYTPKYRIRGFWPVQAPIPSDNTRDQYIIHYIVEYRYLNSRENVSNATQIKYLENGRYRTGVISSWNRLATTTLKRVRNYDGTYSWEEVKPEDGNEQSINQCDIPINPNESVEIRIKACSEAGWPTTMLESDWSNILRIDFPADLLRESSLQTLMQNNSEDVKKVQMEAFIRDKGLLEHIESAFTERSVYFAHTAHNIASGFLTSEQATISLFEYLSLLDKRIATLDSIVNNKKPQLTLSIVDDTETEYQVLNNGTVSIFAGYYCDDNPVNISSNYGNVITKQLYLKILNLNQNSIQMLSKYPGTLAKSIDASSNIENCEDYEDIAILTHSAIQDQCFGQILYLNRKDILGNELYKRPVEASDSITSNDIDSSVTSGSNFVYGLTDNDVLISGALLSASRNKVLATHTLVTDEYSGDKQEFLKKMKKLGAISYEDNTQYLFSNADESVLTIFDSNSKYLVGVPSCGARLYLNPADLRYIQVNSSSNTAYKEVKPEEANAILIPICFQYRMTDRLGNLGIRPDSNTNTIYDISASSVDFSYKKKISIELYLNAQPIRFDLEMSANYRQLTTNTGRIIGIDRNKVLSKIDYSDSIIPALKTTTSIAPTTNE